MVIEMKIGINVNSKKDKDGKILDRIKKLLYDSFKDIDIIVYKDAVGLETAKDKDIEFIISLGGDGTILGTQRKIAGLDIPILGINMGNLGFLTGAELSDLKKAVEFLKSGKYYIEDRMMLKCDARVSGSDSYRSFEALNDMVLSKGTLARITCYDMYIDKKYYNTYNADGIIVSTPTGSTAYSLSAGGPIIYPTLNILSVTPICPHSLGARTIILDGTSSIELKLKNSIESNYLTVDGQLSYELDDNYFIKITSSDKKCKLVKFYNYDYFKVLRDKFTNKK